MKRSLWFLVAILLPVSTLFAQEPAPKPVGLRLQESSVNVLCPQGAGGTQGSGTIICADVAGKPTTWILTANHVVSGLRSVQNKIGDKGEPEKKVTYRDAQIIQERLQGGRVVGEQKYDAKIYSVDGLRDIALLRVRMDAFTEATAVFYLEPEIPQPGTRLYHCGAPGGKNIGGTCSLTSGIISRLGVTIPDFGGADHGVFDQTDCAALGGSSGGMVAREDDGRWIGMITLGLQGDSFHWVVPVRSVIAWAAEAHVEWLLDPSLPRPSEEDLKTIPLELNVSDKPGGSFSSALPLLRPIQSEER